MGPLLGGPSKAGRYPNWWTQGPHGPAMLPIASEATTCDYSHSFRWGVKGYGIAALFGETNGCTDEQEASAR